MPELQNTKLSKHPHYWGRPCDETITYRARYHGFSLFSLIVFSRSMLTVPYNGNPIINDHKFTDYSTSARWIWDGRQPAIIISYPTSASGIIVLLKTRTKYREFLFVKTAVFQPVFNFEQTRTVAIFGEHGMMVKPIRALELHYPMIQFLIIQIGDTMKLDEVSNCSSNFCASCTDAVLKMSLQPSRK